ncbi:hypothetical protein DLAC_06097 [Tieghemostelium lacteum]|uniref:RWD domain-containing protein n=1 Tax=Tieghemostelium lacteum TaxID=361077 RepID=A0A151ZHR1_TIELA|nr:hypothetical protein DLAC_06097 [Tieghemostelium lacteum]|eukprot:KYQ93410.1 hypothetical protein DLAC_06097 [Tieghemostelium lacteum]
MSNREQQENEILAISAIYQSNFKEVAKGSETSYQVQITPSLIEDRNDSNWFLKQMDIEGGYDIYFDFSYPSNYPESELPIINLRSSWLTDNDKPIIYSHLESFYQPNETVIFQMIGWIQENSVNVLNQHYKEKSQTNSYHKLRELKRQLNTSKEEGGGGSLSVSAIPKDDKPPPTIYSSKVVTDKKSKFQAHLAVVHSKEEVDSVLEHLLRSKKINDATHNMYAYRFLSSDGQLNEYYNDDGEAGAGDKMLFTLEKNQCEEILVVVSRWFGGILLGGMRYHWITHVTKEMVNFYKSNDLTPNNCMIDIYKSK